MRLQHFGRTSEWHGEVYAVICTTQLLPMQNHVKGNGTLFRQNQWYTKSTRTQRPDRQTQWRTNRLGKT